MARQPKKPPVEAETEVPEKSNRIDFRRLRNDVLALAMLAVVVFAGISLGSYNPNDPPAQNVYPRDTITNLCGPVGAQVAHHLRRTFGYGMYFVLFALVMA